MDRTGNPVAAIKGASWFGDKGFYFSSRRDHLAVVDLPHVSEAVTILVDLSLMSLGNRPWHNVILEGKPTRLFGEL